jgi:hypothetical protein
MYLNVDSKTLPWYRLVKRFSMSVTSTMDPEDVIDDIADAFYDIYETAAPHGQVVDCKGMRDWHWSRLVRTLTHVGEVLGRTKSVDDLKSWERGYLPDGVKAGPYIQRDNATQPDTGVRLGEFYRNPPPADAPFARFQFVTTSGGGVELFDKVRGACHKYIKVFHKTDQSTCVFDAWKVFSATGSEGRSDCCVFYLAVPHIFTPLVQTFVAEYLWPAVGEMILDKFQPMGLTQVVTGKPIWGIDIASKRKFMDVLGTNEAAANARSSAGQSMGCILGRAILEGMLDVLDADGSWKSLTGGNLQSAQWKIVSQAKVVARRLVRDLG